MLNMNVATPNRRLYSTILAEFPWYSEALVLKPESVLAHSNGLPAFEVISTSSYLVIDVEFKPLIDFFTFII